MLASCLTLPLFKCIYSGTGVTKPTKRKNSVVVAEVNKTADCGQSRLMLTVMGTLYPGYKLLHAVGYKLLHVISWK